MGPKFENSRAKDFCLLLFFKCPRSFSPQSVVQSITEKVPSKPQEDIMVFTFQNTENPRFQPMFLITVGNLALPGGSWFLFPSNLQALLSTMEAISKGHLTRSRCQEGYPGFVHMSVAGMCPGSQKQEIPIHMLICRSPSWGERVWDHLCLTVDIMGFCMGISRHRNVLGECKMCSTPNFYAS